MERHVGASVSGFAILGLLLAVPPPAARASHTVFHFAVERLRVDGNVHGALDGTPDLVEEFEGTMLPSLFQPFFGTTSVSGGALHLQSPGSHLDIPELGLELDLSDVIATAAQLVDGAGDGRVEVHFRPATLGLNHFVHATFMVSGPVGDARFIGLAFTNYSEEVASRETGPAIPGPAMFGHSVGGFLGSFYHVAGNSVPVNTSSAVGAFVLAFDYDDTAKRIVPSFSLDGGGTFQGGLDALEASPFDGSGVGTARLIIGADPRALLETPDLCPLGLWDATVVLRRGGTGDARIRVHATGRFDELSQVPFDLPNQGAQVAVIDRNANTTLAAVTVPSGGQGTGCDPRDGWRYDGASFAYKNRSNAFPPLCAAGSAGGLTRLKVKRPGYPWDAEWRVTFKNVPLPPAVPPGLVDVVVVRGPGAYEDAGGACLALGTGSPLLCTNNPAGTRVRCGY
jgi:hypothetical protein